MNLLFKQFKIEVSDPTNTKTVTLNLGDVHQGFLDAWESIEEKDEKDNEGILNILQQWKKELLSENSENKEMEIWVTGHSLGGAIATLAATSLSVQKFNVKGLYTFGQPRIGNGEFVEKAKQRCKFKHSRYVNNNEFEA